MSTILEAVYYSDAVGVLVLGCNGASDHFTRTHKPGSSPIFPPASKRNCSPASTISSGTFNLSRDSIEDDEAEGQDSTGETGVELEVEEEKRFLITSWLSRDFFWSLVMMSPAVTPTQMSTAMHTLVKRGALTRIMW